MATVTIYGIPQSTYVRTVRMTCHEKGVSYDLEPLAPHSDEILALTPTGKVPAFKHGDVKLFETSAIARYVDECFDGASLQPDDARGRARMNQWISDIADTIYQVMIREIVLPRLGVREVSDADIQASAVVLGTQLDRIDAALQQTAYLAGDELTLCDLFLLPLTFWLEVTPEGKAALPKRAALVRWAGAMNERESAKATVPPMPG